MKAIKENKINIDFDFKGYYRQMGQVNDELEKIKVEASYFKYYDNLTKDDQIIFKTEDKKIRLSEAEFIQNQIDSLKV